MSRDSANAFLEKIDDDLQLREELLSIGKAKGESVNLSSDQLIAFGKDHGFDFSADEIRKAYAARGGARELGDSELEAVAGGKANFNDFNFTHHVDKASPVLM